ncbi:hypothetical protein MNBD_GAMMA11-880 [hydrothermal vent metagenome]|uniref:histidine kinase n=1 Tax=hydrothermal vent metagenome TaxID=652676 RepID=A0A3B0XEF7_9ZZZZ
MVVIENEHLQQKIFAEQVRIIYQQLALFIYGGATASILVVILFWENASQTLLIAWFVAILVMCFGLLYPLQVVYKRANPPDEKMKKWGFVVTLALGVSFTTWGLMGTLFYSREVFEYQLLLNLFVIGGSAVIMIGTTSYMRVYYITCIPVLLPLFVRFVFHGDVLHLALSACLLLFWVIMTAGCRQINQSVVKSLMLGYRNQGLVEEVTQQKERVLQQKEKVMQQKEVAEQANLAKSRFLAAASHDLRQPLQAQALFVAELYGRLHEPDKCRVILARLDDSIHAMRGLFNALLDISKLDAGVVHPKVKNFKISSLLTVIEGEYVAHARDRGLELKIRCRCDREGREVVVRTDPSLLDCVLRNLIVNAIRYTQSGRVLVCCRYRGKYLLVEVWDTGPGIAEKYRRNIFQEFFQIENQQRDRSKGLGLGLSVVRRIAKLLDCPVKVDSIEGKGSRFSISVPLSDSDPVTVRNHTKQQMDRHILGGVSVAVVDDDVAIRQGMRGLLESWGCHVLSAESGKELLSKLSRGNFVPDIIVADYRLAGSLTGVQVVQQARVFLNNDVPAVLITGDIGVDKLQDVQLSGIPLMHKPVQPGKFRTLVQYLLSSTADDLVDEPVEPG